MPMATKLVTYHERVVTYHEGLQPIKSHDLLVTWPYKIKWQTKIIISPVYHHSAYGYQTW